MSFRKNIFLHQWLKNNINLAENRLVNMVDKPESDAISQSNLQIEQEIEKIESEIMALEDKLKGEENPEKQKEIEEEIKKLKEEKEDNKKFLREQPKGMEVSFIYAGLTNKLNSLDQKKDRDQRKLCLETLKELKRPIKTDAEFENVVKDWMDNSNELARLESEELDYMELSYLVESDLGRFFDDDIISRMELANETMKKAESVLLTMDPIDEAKLKAQALKDWEGRKKELDDAYEKAKKEGKDDIAELVDQERRTSQPFWVHDRTLQLEKKKSRMLKLRDRVPEETIEQARAFVIEARGLRENVIRKYLERKIIDYKKQFRKTFKKNPNAFGETSKKQKAAKQDIEHFISGFKKEYLDEDRDLFNRGRAHLESLLMTLNCRIGDIGEFDKEMEVLKDRDALLEELKQKNKRLTEVMSQIPADEVDALIAKTKEDEQTRLLDPANRTEYDEKPNGSVIHNGDIKALEGLKFDPKRYAEIQAILENDTEKPIPNEELIQIKYELDHFDKIFKRLDDLNDANKADEVIKLLSGIQSVEEMKKVLVENFGQNRIKTVSPAVFEDKYRAYTKKGNMVFYERGDDWGIIINEAALNEDAGKMGDQIAHELRHLQFDKNPYLKQEYLNKYQSAENWSEIKEAFVNSTPEKRPPGYTGDKTTFTKNDWEDEDVINELYAMETAILAGKANKELTGLIEKTEILPITKIRGFEEEGSAEGIMAQSGKEGAGKEGEEAQVGSPEDYEKKTNEIDETIKKYLDGPYIAHIPGAAAFLEVLKNFNKETKELNENFADPKNRNAFLSSVIDDRIKKTNEALEKVKLEIEKASENIPNQVIHPIRSIWNKTYFMGLCDIVQLGRDVKEYVERRHKRKKADHAARLGMALFEKLPLIGDIGLEAEARKQKAEAEEVNEWKSRLETKDAWELIDTLKNLNKSWDPNVDQFKAVLRILADKGRIDWQEPVIWELLNKLQDTTSLSPNDKMLLNNPILIRQRLHQACGAIWDYDEFLTLERKNESSYGSGKKEHMETIDKFSSQINERLAQLYQNSLAGKQVDPMEYEALLEYSIIKGKSYSENVMFYLIAGMAQGILTPDRGSKLNNYLNEWPPIDWIVSGDAPKSKADFESLCETYFGKEYKNGRLDGVNSDFKNFYWTRIQNSVDVTGRVRKSVTQRKWDHDWSRGIAPIGDAYVAERFLSGRSGEKTTQETAVENMYVGLLQWFEENAKTGKKSENWRASFTRQISYLCMTEGITSDVAYRKDEKFQREPAIFTRTARENGVSNHEGWMVGQHRDKMRDFISRFDEGLAGFFALITNTEAAASKPEELRDSIKVYLSNTYPGLQETVINNITDLNDVFKYLNTIISHIMSKVSDTAFLSHITTLREGIPAK